jgi:diguanylate cyclase (GGDEF)-like protein
MEKIIEGIYLKYYDNWKNFINAIANEIGDVILTDNIFQAVLDKIKNHPKSFIDSIVIEILSFDKTFNIKTFGTKGDSDPIITETVNLDTVKWFQYRISIWRSSMTPSSALSIDECKKLISDIICRYWKTPLRDEKTRIISETIANTKEYINKTKRQFEKEFNHIAYYFSDIDKFKDINSSYGQAEGDGVILQFSAQANLFVSQKNAIAIHRSGDEFIFILFCDTPEEAITFAYELEIFISEIEFVIKDKDSKRISVKRKITTGFYISANSKDAELTYEQCIASAEQAMKDSAGTKKYSSANLSNSDVIDVPSVPLNKNSLNVAKIIIKTLSCERPFENVWLNFICERVYNILKNNKELSEIGNLLEWITVKVEENCKAAKPFDNFLDYSQAISNYDILLSISRAFLMYNLNEEISDSYCIKKNGLTLELHSKLHGNIFSLSNLSAAMDLEIGDLVFQQFICPVALIKIGHTLLDIPKEIFADIIIVDDRPSKGGGLPDFWEATLARLISTLNQKKFISKIYFIGDQNYAKKTVEILTEISCGKLDPNKYEEIANQLNVRSEALRNAVDILKGNVEFFSTTEDLVENYQVFITNHKNKAINNSDVEFLGKPRFLDKELRLDKFALTKEDGFRIETLSEAFPLMLEIARKASMNNQIIDQAGIHLGELIDFKVELSNPLVNIIPHYYRTQAQSFQEYYEANFLDETNGLFARHFKNQLPIVLNHVKEAIINSTHQYSTRRAILIIPNEVKSSIDFSPLGLISIRIVPRFDEKTNVFLIFSFTWRTVEALVGFPYSFFGSIKYSEYLTERIKESLPLGKPNVTFDKVSYIAHSLHIFMDDFGQNIAKRISDDASI